MKKVISMLLFLLATFLPAAAQESCNIIPKPQSIKVLEGKDFILTEKTTIGFDNGAARQAELLQAALSGPTGWDFPLRAGKKGDITLKIDSTTVTSSEGYRLVAGQRGVSITGHDAAGVFYGIQTFLQLLPKEIVADRRQRGVEWRIRPVEVNDAPNYPWRGMMIDVARYFYHVDFIKKFIDMMAMYKLNKLQFHLIDDSGWRLEIKKYPRLTEVGAWAGPEEKRLGGFYTQEDIRELLAYAEARGVEIIPEIEFPAHVLSAIVAYPWLSCQGKQHEVQTQQSISPELLCVSKDSVMNFLHDVLDETIALFPSKYINIGGDEAIYDRWKTCPRCQALMKREGLSEVSQLQGWLTNIVAGWMKEKGRTVVGWEEVFMRGKVSTPIVGVMWHNVDDTLKARVEGHRSIIAPVTHLYFDFPERKDKREIKAATWMPAVPLKKTYETPLLDYSLATSSVLGVQGCYWSDQFIHGTVLQELPQLDENRSERYAEYLMFPRLTALSELGWTRKADRNFTDYERRMATHYPRLTVAGIHYRLPEPVVEKSEKNTDGTYSLTLATPVADAAIHYTTDGSTPTYHSPRYNGTPIRVANPEQLRAITVMSRTHVSLPTR